MVEHGLLSGRETEILRQVSCGLSNKEIAGELSITVGTTKGHLYRIFRKLDVSSRTAADAKSFFLDRLSSSIYIGCVTIIAASPVDVVQSVDLER